MMNILSRHLSLLLSLYVSCLLHPGRGEEGAEALPRQFSIHSKLGLRDANRIDQEFERFLAEELPINYSAENALSYMQRCGNQTECSEELECSSIGLGERCMPSEECLKPKLEEWEQKYNQTALKEEVFAAANITELDILQLLLDSENRKDFLASDQIQALGKAATTILADASDEIATIEEQCLGITKQDAGSSLEYFGFHFEAGAIFDFSLQIFFCGTDDTFSTFGRVCGGVGVGAGAEASLIYGAYTGATSVSQLSGVLFVADADFHFGIGGGFAGGRDFRGNGVLEFTVGPGLGLELIGLGFCQVFV